MNISSDEVKSLREETGVSIMECKRALEEAGGDRDEARKILASRGAMVAQKKKERATRAGRVDVYIHGTGDAAAMVKLLCETDFVARSDAFKTLAHDIAMHIVATRPDTLDELLSAPFIKDDSMSVKDLIERTISVTGENITLADYAYMSL